LTIAPVTTHGQTTALTLPSVGRFMAGTDPATGALSLLWQVTGANSVTLDNRPVGARGSEGLALSDSSTHVLRATNSLGTFPSSVVGPQGSSRALQGRVVAPPPIIDQFVIAHQRAGQPYTLVWQTRKATTIALDGARVGAAGRWGLSAGP